MRSCAFRSVEMMSVQVAGVQNSLLCKRGQETRVALIGGQTFVPVREDTDSLWDGCRHDYGHGFSKIFNGLNDKVLRDLISASILAKSYPQLTCEGSFTSHCTMDTSMNTSVTQKLVSGFLNLTAFPKIPSPASAKMSCPGMISACNLAWRVVDVEPTSDHVNTWEPTELS
jgi:hypothetical protein